MNVEEGMKLLKDPAVWNVELTPRQGVFAKQRLITWQFATVGIAAAVVVAVVASSVVLLGNAQPAPQLGGPPASQTPTPRSTPTIPPDPSGPPSTDPLGLDAPAGIFDGDCTSFISDDEMSDIVQSPVTYMEQEDMGANNDDDLALYRQQGLISCAWQGNDGQVSLMVLRSEIAPSDAHDKCIPFAWGEASLQDNLCVFDVVAHGLRMNGDVAWPTKSESKSIAKRLVDYFETTDPGDAVGTRTAPPAGSWDQQNPCDLLNTVLIDGQPVDLEPRDLGSDAGVLPVIDQLFADYVPYGCGASTTGTDGEDLTVTAYPVGNGAWQFDEALDSLDSDEFEATTLTGFDHAVVEDASHGERIYHLVSGPNYLRVSFFGETDDEALIVQLIDLPD